jgi:flagellar biogenesis protein FliO
VRSLEALERLALTPQHSLHLVRIGGREVVVATYPQGCVLLTERALGAGQ